jgi:broad specificity phosphatase PhoE
MREFLFLRHGQTDWNLAHRIQGQIKDVPLNQTGIKQSEDAAALLLRYPLDLIVSSTLDRAAMTARIIAVQTGSPLIFDARLIERNWGVAEGMAVAEFANIDPETFFTSDGRQDWVDETRQPKGAETREELAERASIALFDLLSRHEDKRLLLVTHGAWLRALVYRLTGEDRDSANAIPYRAYENPEGWHVEPLMS